MTLWRHVTVPPAYCWYQRRTRRGHGRGVFDVFRVRVRFRDKILGGVPRTEEAVSAWLGARGLSTLESETLESVDLVQGEERCWTGFKRDDSGLYLEARQVRAMLKECAGTLGMTKEVRGLRQHLQHGTFVKPDRIHLGVAEPTGTMECFGQVQSPRGPRSIVKRVDYVKSPRIAFEIWTVTKGKLREDMLREILVLAQENGLGAMRTQGFGQFDVEEFSPVSGTR